MIILFDKPFGTYILGICSALPPFFLTALRVLTVSHLYAHAILIMYLPSLNMFCFDSLLPHCKLFRRHNQHEH